MKIKIPLMVLACLLLICLCGCWDYREYENLALVSGIGFDTDSTARQVTVTIEYLVPNNHSAQSDGSTSKPGTAVVKATAASADDALETIQKTTGKRLFYGYMQCVIIGGDAAKMITGDIIALVARSPNIRTASYLAVTPGKAEDVLNTISPNAGHATSKEIHDLIDQALSSGTSFPVSVLDFEQKLSISGEEPVAPVVVIQKAEKSEGNAPESSSSSPSLGSSETASSSNSENNVSSGAIELEQKKGFLKLKGLAAFKDEKLVGWLTDSESLGFLWIDNKNPNPYEAVSTSEKPDVNNTSATRVSSSKSKIDVSLDSGKPVVTISTSVKAELRKAPKNLKADALTPEVLGGMEQQLAENIKAEINSSLKRGQKELKTDIFRIGVHLYNKYPKLWKEKYQKEWDNIYPTLQINVKVNATLTNTGTSYKKFQLR